jgi:hypothetical protein
MPGEAAWVVGVGYLVGALLLTLWMRTLSMAAIPFGVVAIAGPLATVAGVLGMYLRRRDGAALSRAIRGASRALVDPPGLGGRARLAWRLLLGWIVLRFVLLALDVEWQPLYP